MKTNKLALTAGWLLFGTGVIHNLIGFGLGWPIFVEFHQAGWWNVVETAEGIHFDRSAMLWFVVTGFFWIAFGQAMVHAAKLGVAMPASLGWWFIGIGLAVGIVLPVSGAWLFLPQGVVLIMSVSKERFAQQA